MGRVGGEKCTQAAEQEDGVGGAAVERNAGHEVVGPAEQGRVPAERVDQDDDPGEREEEDLSAPDIAAEQGEQDQQAAQLEPRGAQRRHAPEQQHRRRRRLGDKGKAAVVVDGDDNGTVDSGEPGIANVLLNLYDESGDLAGIAETDDAGRYHIAELRPGIYVLRLDEDSLPGGLLATWDRDGGADGSAVIDLTGGVDILDANFGFRQGLPLTGFDVGPLAIWGALMVLFGMALVVTVSVSTRAAATPTSKQ
mgnify:CR=1 FL=1